MNSQLRLLLILFTILCCATIAGATMQELPVGAVFEGKCVLEGKTGFSADFVAPKSKPKWPSTADEMDDFLGVPSTEVLDGPTTPGRNKTVWKPNKDTKITHEQNPYHPDAPDWH